MLIASQWNKSKAAQRFNWSRMTLYRKLVKYHIVHSDVVTGEPERRPRPERGTAHDVTAL